MIEFQLVKNIFTPLDNCLTKAYDYYITKGESGQTIYVECKDPILLQRALDCGYALTDELYNLTYQQSNGKRSIATNTIKQQCSN